MKIETFFRGILFHIRMVRAKNSTKTVIALCSLNTSYACAEVLGQKKTGTAFFSRHFTPIPRIHSHGDETIQEFDYRTGSSQCADVIIVCMRKRLCGARFRSIEKCERVGRDAEL